MSCFNCCANLLGFNSSMSEVSWPDTGQHLGSSVLGRQQRSARSTSSLRGLHAQTSDLSTCLYGTAAWISHRASLQLPAPFYLNLVQFRWAIRCLMSFARHPTISDIIPLRQMRSPIQAWSLTGSPYARKHDLIICSATHCGVA